jgi:hypothetical protein
MVNIKYRESTSATVPGSTTAKGTPLTNLEMDGNLKSIKDNIELLTENTSITADNTNVAVVYPMWALAATGTDGTGATPYRISPTKMYYVPSTNTLTVARLAGTADNVVTNANLTGMVTSVGNTTTVVTNANLNGMVTSSGNTTTVVTNANLTGMVTSVGNTTTVVTNANLTGEVTSVGNATTVTNAAVLSKVVTGWTPGAGIITATDSVLEVLQKLAGNDGVNANLTGEVTSVGNATTVTNAAVIGKVLTGYVSGAGTIAATDSVLQAFQKLNGNVALKLDSTNGVLTGATLNVAPATDDNSLKVASTSYVLGQLATASQLPVAFASTAQQGTSFKMARSDHVHPDVRPTFRAYLNTANQSVTTATLTRVTLNAETFDTGSMFDSATNYRFTPTISGYYQFNASLTISTGSTTTDIVLAFYKNGTEYSRIQTAGISASTGGPSYSDVIFLNGSTDYVELWASNTSSNTPAFAFGATKTFMTGTLISKG